MPWDSNHWWQRPGIALAGVAHAVAAAALWTVRDLISVGLFWPMWFGGAALLLVAFALWPSSPLLYRMSGMAVVVAWASRALWLAVDIPTDGWQPVDARALVGALVGAIAYSMLAALFWLAWVSQDLRRWQDMQWARRKVRKTS